MRGIRIMNRRSAKYIGIAVVSAIVTIVVLVPHNTVLHNVFGKRELAGTSIDCAQQEDEMKMAIQDFSKLMDFFGVQVALIEPKIIFCLLHPFRQQLLRKRGFHIGSYLGVKNVVNFAMFEKNITIDSRHVAMSGFRHSVTRGQLRGSWHIMQSDAEHRDVVNHHFFKRGQILIHAAMFFRRGNYLWHSSLPVLPLGLSATVTQTDLLFAQHDAAYEWFEAKPLANSLLCLPSNPSYFLLQLESSRFLECNLSRSVHLGRIIVNEQDLAQHDILSRAFMDSLTVLKHKLHSQLMDFYLFGGTLLGWYRQCDIIPYTSDIDYATFARNAEIEKFWVDNFHKSVEKIIPLERILGFPEEAYEIAFWALNSDKKVDLFFVYENSDETLWISGHESRNFYIKFNFPKFHLCSGDMFGNKVLVPCETEAVLRVEYGPNWFKKVKTWVYNRMAKNLGQKVYWPKDKRRGTVRSYG